MSVFRRVSAATVALAAILWTAPAMAQDNSDEIVVTGTRLDPQQVRQQAADFVRRSGLAAGQIQVARWLGSVCPKAIGLSDPQAAQVERRVRAIAAAAGIKTAPRDCENNVTLVFTKDAPAVMKEISERKPQSLSGLSPARRHLLRTGTAPVLWWHSSSVHDRDGMAENSISVSWAGIEGSAGGLPIGDNVTSTQQYNGGSNVRTATVRGLSSATAVIDLSRTGDATLEMLTDYAAMVTLAEIAPGDPPRGSILSIFATDMPPASLTDWDLALLRSLYRMPLDRRARIQRGHLVNGLVADRTTGTPARGSR